MSFGKRQQFGNPPIHHINAQTHTPTPRSTTKSIVLGALTGIFGALALIALIVGGIRLNDRSHALQLADRFAYQPVDGPGYVNRKHNAQSRIDKECLGLWDNTLKGVRNTMLCYSTRNPERLCDATEKELFLGVIDEYLHFERQMAATLAATPKPVLDIIEGTLSSLPKPVPRDGISDAWRQLARIGVIGKGDFGWFPDDFVANSFAEVEVEKDVCSDS